MTDDNVDTVTPLASGGLAVTDSSVDLTTRNVSQEDYDTAGRTRVRARRGYQFASANEEIPVITVEGINVTASEAEDLVKESGGLVQIVNKDEE